MIIKPPTAPFELHQPSFPLIIAPAAFVHSECMLENVNADAGGDHSCSCTFEFQFDVSGQLIFITASERELLSKQARKYSFDVASLVELLSKSLIRSIFRDTTSEVNGVSTLNVKTPDVAEDMKPENEISDKVVFDL